MKRAYVEIDLVKIAKNIRQIQSGLKSKTHLMAVVKADGYGHGASEIANIALANGATYLGVAWVMEAAELRSRGITSPILILSEPTTDLSYDILALNLTQTVYTYQYAELLSQKAKELNKIAKIHIKVDTGMNRIGIAVNDVLSLIDAVKHLENIELEGVFTHFPSADEPKDSKTLEQINDFETCITLCKQHYPTIRYFHMANSAGTKHYPQSHLDMIRIGHDLYSGALSFKSKVAYIHDATQGETVSYGRTHELAKPTCIATISVGYADGFPRALSNCGHVIIHGKKYPIVGRICMDMTMVDIGYTHDIKIGDTVTLIGYEAPCSIDIHEVASLSKTIDYEIMCGIGKRVPRIYI